MTADESKTLYMFDIETEGLAGGSDRITTIGFKEFGHSGKHTIYYLLPDECEPVDSADINASSTVDLRPVESEEELLQETQQFIDEQNINDPSQASIVGFNSSGFDIDFIRTRNSFQTFEHGWILSDVNHLDIMNAIKYEFNTTSIEPENAINTLTKKYLNQLHELVFGHQLNENVPVIKQALKDNKDQIGQDEIDELIDGSHLEKDDFSSSNNDLDGAYDLLVADSTYTVVEDPFDDSKECVDAFMSGNLTDLVQHNVADLERTDALTQKIIEFVANNEQSKLPLLQSVKSQQL